jgi:hypothetical protein
VVLAAGNWVLLALAAPPPAFPAVVATTTSVPPAAASASRLASLSLRQIHEEGSGWEQAVCGAPNKRKKEREKLKEGWCWLHRLDLAIAGGSAGSKLAR